MKMIIKYLLDIIKKKNHCNGFSLTEIIIGITIFSVVLGTIIFCYASLLRIEIKSTERIYKNVEKVNAISKKFYTEQEDEWF